MKSIGRDLDPGRTGAVGKVSSVIAIKATKELQDSPTRKATEVPLLLLPSSSIHSTSPVSRHTAE